MFNWLSLIWLVDFGRRTLVNPAGLFTVPATTRSGYLALFRDVNRVTDTPGAAGRRGLRQRVAAHRRRWDVNDPRR
jgi:hypothetical protein